ncbi:MAG: hypothetical protein ACI9BW_000103 [Gammaproteobacteria bacterium]|jgi:hypothetical protein
MTRKLIETKAGSMMFALLCYDSTAIRTITVRFILRRIRTTNATHGQQLRYLSGVLLRSGSAYTSFRDERIYA